MEHITHDAVTMTAIDKVLKARAELIMARRFYGVLISNVVPVPSRRFPTMATNGSQHFFNPEYITSLPQEQVLGVQVHESEHDARLHHSRRGTRDPEEWNICTDLAINGDIIKEGFKLPEGFLYEARFVGMSAEDIYRIRELERKQQQQPQPQPQQDGDDEAEQGLDDADIDPPTSSEEGDEQQDQDGGDQKPEDEGQSGDSEQGNESEDGGDTGNAGDAEGDEDGEGEGGDAEGEAETETEGKGAGGEAGDSESEGEEAEGQQTSGDPGHCGEVLDAADEIGELTETEQKWERIVRQAASMAKAVGELPGHVTREIERRNDPARDWRDELRAWLENTGKKALETWNRPNKRFVHAGVILPSARKEGISKAVAVIDTSGSMDDIALACVNREMQAAFDDGLFDELVVVYGDMRVTRVDEYRAGDTIEFDPRGGGGTVMEPLFKYVADEHSDASLIVCFTDLEWWSVPSEPHCPVLFAVTGYPDQVRQYLANAPWNAPGIDVGAH
jgi:predicted metal-dependent peptidase